jgi:glycosyltransferase involved in cell wall biosynthesis
MNLLFVIPWPIFGGPHNQAMRLNASLMARGWATTVVLPADPGNAAARLEQGGVEVLPVTLRRVRASIDPRVQVAFGAGLVSGVAALRRIIRGRKIDLLLSSGLLSLHGPIAGRLEEIPVVWQVVDSRTPTLLRHLTMPFFRRLADAAMFDGQRIADLHLGRRLLRVPSFIYYPPVDADRFRPSEERRAFIRRELGIPPEAPVVGMVANINPQKGIQYFVRAAGHIHRSMPQTHYLAVGAWYQSKERYSQAIKSEIQLAGIPLKQLFFVGYKANVEDFYAAMDVKLITSVPRSEGTTTTAMEAMACGVPVIATDVGAIREVIEDRVTGILVPPLDPEAMARATVTVLASPEVRTRMGVAARKRAAEMFNVDSCVNAHIAAFEAAIAHRANPTSLTPATRRSLT